MVLIAFYKSISLPSKWRKTFLFNISASRWWSFHASWSHFRGKLYSFKQVLAFIRHVGNVITWSRARLISFPKLFYASLAVVFVCMRVWFFVLHKHHIDITYKYFGTFPSPNIMQTFLILVLIIWGKMSPYDQKL